MLKKNLAFREFYDNHEQFIRFIIFEKCGQKIVLKGTNKLVYRLNKCLNWFCKK